MFNRMSRMMNRVDQARISLFRIKALPNRMTNFIAAFSFLAFVIVSGTVAYMKVEGWGAFNSLYQTLIVISTLGIRQVKEMSRAGEIVTLLLIIGGVGAFTFFFSAMATLLVEGQLRSILGRRKLVHPHGLRHTHAAELAAENVRINVIQAQLGHSNAAMTSLARRAPTFMISHCAGGSRGGSRAID